MKYQISQFAPENRQGFSLIEVLIAISIFSIGFMALTTTIWSSSQTRRTTAFTDNAVLACQDMVEQLTVIPIDDGLLSVKTPGEKETCGSTVNYSTLNETDSDGDGIPDFKTISIEVSNQGKLKMKSYYRRKIN